MTTFKWPTVDDRVGDLPAFKRLCNTRFTQMAAVLNNKQSSLDWVNVVSDFGAIGNGVTDDTAKIQQAAAAAAGKVLYFPPGLTYAVSGTIAAQSGTTIVAANATLVQHTNGVPLVQGTAVTGVTIDGGTYVGVGSGTAFSDGDAGLLYFVNSGGSVCSDVRIRGVTVRDAASGISVVRGQRVWVADCYVENYKLYGILASQSSDFFIAQNRVYNCQQSGGAVAYGIMATGNENGGVTQQRGTIVDNKIDGVPSWDGIMTHDCADLTIARNQIRNVRQGIDVGHLLSTNFVRNLVIADNFIEGTTTDTWGGGAAQMGGIYCVGYDATHRVARAQITGNVIVQTYSIVSGVAGGLPGSIMVGHADDVQISGNVVAAVGSATAGGNGVVLYGTLNRVSLEANVLQGAMANGGIRIDQATIDLLALGDGNVIRQTTTTDYGILVNSSTIGALKLTPPATNSTIPYGTISSTVTTVSGLTPEDTASGLRLRGSPVTLGDAGTTFTLQGPTSTGANIAAAAIELQSGLGTGNSAADEVRVRVGNPGASGSTAHTPYSAIRVIGTAQDVLVVQRNAPTAGAGRVVDQFTVNGTAKADLGVDGGGGGLIAGSAAGDLNVISRGFNVLFSTDSGATLHGFIDTSGRLKWNAGIYQKEAAALIHSQVALTNGAAAATGTLTNAPAAGNPTKWIPIDDNGTTRYVPAW